MNIELDFIFVSRDGDGFACYSPLSLQTGLGKTMDEAMRDHLNKFNAQVGKSNLIHAVDSIPDATIKTFKFTLNPHNHDTTGDKG